MTPETNLIQFREIRDFSQVLSASFAFIRQNFWPLIKHPMLIIAPLIVLANIWSYFYVQQQLEAPPITFEDLLQFYSDTAWQALPNLLLGFIIFGIFSSMVYAYMKYYQESNGADVETGQLFRLAAPYITRITIGGIATSFIILLGGILCVLPGIFFAVTLALVYPIMMWENTGIFDAMTRSANLIKGNWWNTLGIVVILALISYVLVFVLSLPVMITGIVIGATSSSGDFTQFTEIITIIGAITGVLYYPIYLIMLVGIALHYFNLVEQHDGTGLIDRIDTIGDDDPRGPGGLDAPTFQ